VVASALGIPALLPFLKAVCLSKKSWQARHTGIKIVQQIAILMGCAVLPHLKALVDIIKHGLKDENQKVTGLLGLLKRIGVVAVACLHVMVSATGCQLLVMLCMSTMQLHVGCWFSGADNWYP
jgi:hypothetical protein